MNICARSTQMHPNTPIVPPVSVAFKKLNLIGKIWPERKRKGRERSEEKNEKLTDYGDIKDSEECGLPAQKNEVNYHKAHPKDHRKFLI